MISNRALRALLLTAAAGLAAAAVHQVHLLDDAREELVRTARDLEVADPELLGALARTGDPQAGRSALARALLRRAVEEPGYPELRARRLDEAARLGHRTLDRRPASWEAAMIAGAATYLRWSLERDPRLLQEYGTWEEPLLLARRLAPVRREPERYLATAYLELWPALSDAKRRLARELLAGAFEDPATFARLVDAWIEVSDGDATPVPSEPWAWSQLRDAQGRRGDWSGYCAAWRTHRIILERDLRARLASARELLARERMLAARTELLGVAADAPTERRFAPLVEAALREAPYGPASGAVAERLAGWLRWARDLAMRDEAPFSDGAVVRLRGAVLSNGSPAPADAALAAWAAAAVGDLARAERLERSPDASWSEEWAPYWIEKGELLAGRGRPGEAATALERVHPDWRSHPAYLRARLALATARGAPEEVAAARAALEAHSATAWPATAWRWRQGGGRLEPLVAGGGAGLRVGLVEVPRGGAAVEVLWDGEAVACRAVNPVAGTDAEIAVGLPVRPGLHLLEVRTLAARAGGVVPGRVTVAGGPPPPPR